MVSSIGLDIQVKGPPSEEVGIAMKYFSPCRHGIKTAAIYTRHCIDTRLINIINIRQIPAQLQNHHTRTSHKHTAFSNPDKTTNKLIKFIWHTTFEARFQFSPRPWRPRLGKLLTGHFGDDDT